MSKYTRSIRNILQANAGNNNITTLSGLYNVANTTLFPQDALNVISAEYREQLVTSFALHYMNDELGLETLALWKIALAEKLYNYGSYINLIYANIDKQVFADYRVRQVNTQGSNQNTKHGTGTVTDAHTSESETNVTDSLTHSQTVQNTESGTVAGTGTVTNAHTGTDSTSHTGTDENAKTGYDTLAQTGTDANAHTGTQGVAGTNSSSTANTGTTGNDHNIIQINYDTPQGSLDNMRTPGGSAKGTGVAYANGQTYNYMSSASEVDESNVQTDNTQQETTGSDSTTTTYNDTQTETRNLQDQTTYNSEDTRTLDLTDATTYGGINTETRNTLDTTSNTGEVQTTGSDGKTGQTTFEDSSTNTQTRNTTDTDQGEHAEETAETDYSLNWEMLYKSMPLLNKLWDVFDDLFMCIY